MARQLNRSANDIVNTVVAAMAESDIEQRVGPKVKVEPGPRRRRIIKKSSSFWL